MGRNVLIHHTTPGGPGSDSPRSEVPREVIQSLDPMLGAALEGRHPTIPGFPDYQLAAAIDGDILWFEVLSIDGPYCGK